MYRITVASFIFIFVKEYAVAFQPSVKLAYPFQSTRQHSITNLQRPSFLALNSKAEDADNEIERLKSMAAKLRAEAAALEAEQAQSMALVAERAFQKFDIDKDGKVSFEELKAGLEKEFKMELPEKRVQKLMAAFDKTGAGSLQLEEFVSLDRFKNRLDQLARDEKAMALEKEKEAKVEEDLSKFLQAQLDTINDRPPTPTDKIISILPYLFPLLDGIQYGRFLILDNPDNIFSVILAVVFALYRSIPFGGLIAFFALSSLSGNPSINRLIRFNMQQAIFIDIALFFPSLIAALYSLIAGSAGLQLPASVSTIGSDVIFFSLLATIVYCSVSSLLGVVPNKLPLISSAVEQRVPSIDMFDVQGRFKPRKKDDSEKKD